MISLMELFFFSSPFDIFLLLLLLVFLSIVSFKKFLVRKHKGVKLPPGNLGWPLIGETLEFISLGRKGVPENFVQDRMKIFSSEIFRSGLFGESFAIFCGPIGNKFLFTNENKQVKSWWPKSVKKVFPASYLQASDNGELPKSIHKMFQEYLKLEMLQTYIGTMDSIAKQHFEDNWENKEEVIVHPLSQSYTFSLVCRLFISVDDPSRVHEFVTLFGLLSAGLMSVPIDLPWTPFHRSIKAAAYLRQEFLSIIKQRKIDLSEKKTSSSSSSPPPDILSHMLHEHTDDNNQLMNECGIASKVIGFISGGYHTTSGTITLIVKYLGELPEIYEKVRKEQIEIAELKEAGEMLNWVDIQKMHYSWNVAREVLRLAPPLQGSFREAVTDITFAGYMIPKGWKLYWNTYSTHTNPEYFPNPKKFDPTRFEGKGPAPYTFVPFGGGPRMCPGKEFARLVILVFIHNLVTRYKWKNSIPDEKVIFNPLPEPIHGLPIRLQAS